MQAVKSSGTRLERRLWAMLAGLGVRGWRKNDPEIAGRPDVSFPAQRLVVFVDGCFWHGCPHCRRKLPKTNRAYWKQKIARNVALARRRNAQLRRNGWTVVRIWEHEMADMAAVKAKVLRMLRNEE